MSITASLAGSLARTDRGFVFQADLSQYCLHRQPVRTWYYGVHFASRSRIEWRARANIAASVESCLRAVKEHPRYRSHSRVSGRKSQVRPQLLAPFAVLQIASIRSILRSLPWSILAAFSSSALLARSRARTSASRANVSLIVLCRRQ